MKITTLTKGMVGGTLALLLVTITFPAPRAEAATYAELQAQIQSLLQQIAALQIQLIAQQGAGVSCVAPIQNLAFGDRGTSVTSLQNFLISHGYVIPAGATGYFGSQTQTALQQFQATEGISPALGLNYGPLTRAKIQSRCTVVVTPTPTPEPTPSPTPSLSGEASFDRFAAKEGDDTDLEENDKNAEIMLATFQVDDGDAELNRIDLGFTPDNANDEKDPWDVFSTISIWDGSQKLAEVDASREKNWREDAPNDGDYLLRISGLDYVVSEGDDVELTVKATIQRSVKGTTDGELWNVFVPDDGIRAFDADRVALYTGDTADSVTLNLDRAGASDELIVRRSDEDPDASVLRLESSRTSGYYEVFAFDLDTDDSENDIDIRELPIQLTVDQGTLEDYVRSVRLDVDGEHYTDEDITDGATGIVTFNFDRGELTIDAGDRVTIVVEVEFRSLADANEGTTIVGHVDADDIEAEGGDDLNSTQLQGAATGETHSLYTKGSDVESKTTSAVVTSVDGANNDYATFSLTVNLTAFGQDVYIPVGAAGVTYQLQDAIGTALSASGTAVVTSSARERNGYFHIPEGSTDTLTLDVTYVPGTPNTTARLQLMSVNFNDTTTAPDQSWLALPASTYRTPTRTIVN